MIQAWWLLDTAMSTIKPWMRMNANQYRQQQGYTSTSDEMLE